MVEKEAFGASVFKRHGALRFKADTVRSLESDCILFCCWLRIVLQTFMLGLFASELNLDEQCLAWIVCALEIIMCIVHSTEEDQQRLVN